MKKTTLLFIFLIICGYQCHAQAVSGYLFSQSAEPYSAVIGNNSTAMGDDGVQDNIDIGFSFNFGGVEYTTFSISTNGFIRLGNGIGASSWINELSGASNQVPVIAAFWDDNNRNSGAIQYSTMGIAPNRLLEVGWNMVNIGNNGQPNAAVSGSFKIRLHEATGQIDFIYGTPMTWVGGITASIGLNDPTSFVSITPAMGSATASSSVSNNQILSTEFVANTKYTFLPVPMCSGTPNPGSTIALSSSICLGESATLMLENETPGYGVTYQWQSSPNGVTFTAINNATSSTLTIPQTAGTYYRCIVTCNADDGASATSTAVQVMMNAGGCYCIPTYTNGKTDGDLISNVVITGTTLSNNTGTAPVNPSYTYFTGQPNYTAVLQAGVTYEIQITVGTYGDQNSAVWIDYNDDHVFSPDERVGYTTAEVPSMGTAIYPILLDCNALPGVHRMRVRDVWNNDGANIDPCANYGYGEVEDYDVEVLGSDLCSEPYDLAVGAFNAYTAELQWMAGCGQSLWDVHVTTAGGGLPAGIPSNPDVDTHPLTVNGLSPNTDYEFYVLGHCNANGDSEWAGPFAFTTGPLPVGNDECETSYTLTPGGDFNENPLVGTNAGSTKTISAPNPTCATFGFGGDVWFSVVVPASGNITVETQSEAGSPLIDTGMTLFSGTCGALTSLGCSDDEGVDAFSILSVTGLTPGSTIYARVWEYANDMVGEFRISAYDSSLASSSFDTEGFAYYPNPVKNFLNLSYTKEISEVKVFNLLGQQVLLKSLAANSGLIDMSPLAKGAYLVKVTSEGKTKTIKIIKD